MNSNNAFILSLPRPEFSLVWNHGHRKCYPLKRPQTPTLLSYLVTKPLKEFKEIDNFENGTISIYRCYVGGCVKNGRKRIKNYAFSNILIWRVGKKMLNNAWLKKAISVLNCKGHW